MRDLFAMQDFVVLEHLLAIQLFIATPAWKQRLLSVGLEMLFLVGHLVERLATALDRTSEWLLSSVGPKMIKQVVPFEENFSTVGVVTGKCNSWPAADVLVEMKKTEL